MVCSLISQPTTTTYVRKKSSNCYEFWQLIKLKISNKASKQSQEITMFIDSTKFVRANPCSVTRCKITCFASQITTQLTDFAIQRENDSYHVYIQFLVVANNFLNWLANSANHIFHIILCRVHMTKATLVNSLHSPWHIRQRYCYIYGTMNAASKALHLQE